MRIALVTIFELNHVTGGVAQYIRRTAKGLSGLGHEVEIISGDGFLPLRNLRQARLAAESMTGSRARFPWSRVTLMRYRMWRLRLRAGQMGRADVVNAQDALAGAALLPVSGKPGIPLLTSFLGYTALHALSEGKAEKGDRYHDFLVRIETEAFAGSARVICADRSRVSYVRAMGLNNAVLAPGGLDTEAFRPLDGDHGDYILYVGNLLPEKGVAGCLQAFARIAPEFPWLRLVFVGQGPMESRLMRQARDAGLGDRVEFRGRVENSNLTEYYARARACLLPTIPLEGIKDGPAYAAQEAMACGTPVIVSDVGGLAELVQDGVNGLVVPPGDALSISRALRRLLTDKSLSEKLGREGRETIVKNYSLERCAARLEGIYQEVIREST